MMLRISSFIASLVTYSNQNASEHVGMHQGRRNWGGAGNLIDQLTLFQSEGGADYAHHITTLLLPPPFRIFRPSYGPVHQTNLIKTDKKNVDTHWFIQIIIYISNEVMEFQVDLFLSIFKYFIFVFSCVSTTV